MARTSRVLRTPTGFTLVELLVVITIIALLVALILPAVQSAREASRRSVCSANMRAVAQAVVTFESHRKQYPAVIDRNPAAATPNADGSTGYSWIFMVLPYMEQQQIFDAVSLGTSKLTAGPFSAAATSGATPVAAEGIPILGCPAYSEGKTTSGAAPGLALTNYKAMAGVFVTSVAPGIPGVSGTQSQTVVPGAGLVQFAPEGPGTAASRLGGRQSSVLDGITNTVIAAETREPGYSCWVDGASCWVVALRPFTNNPKNIKGLWMPSVKGLSGLGVGGDTTPWLPGWRGTTWSWGPSSNHTLGIALHAFGDTHVAAIEPNIDGLVYASIASRAGDESELLSQ